MSLSLRIVPGVICVLLLLGCSRTSTPEPVVHAEKASILGGQEELTFSAVGALVYYRNGRYFGEFCTATLIGPQWALTTASCIEDVIQLLAVSNEDFQPSLIQLYIGNDAGTAGTPPVDDTTLHDIDQVFVHPNWNPDALIPNYDIGLIHLSGAVPDAEPLPIQRASIARLRGTMLTYVGFGVANGELGTGRGDKRSTTLELTETLPITYTSRHQDNGVCIGDRGAPGLVQVDGSWNIVGLTSLYNEDAPICMTYSMQTRVDAFSSWIDVMTGEFVECDPVRNPCACDNACEADGLCDENACGLGDCSVVYNCADACETPPCIAGCLSGGTGGARIRFENLKRCIVQFCPPNADGSPDANCIQRRCLNEFTTCFESGPIPNLGNNNCGTVYDCTRGCNNEACRIDCRSEASPDGLQASMALLRCRERNCRHLNNPSAIDACAHAACPSYFRRCFVPDDCSLAGGDCPADTTCFRERWGADYCSPTLGLPLGSMCDPRQPQCDDGVVCSTVFNQTICRAACQLDDDCAAAGTECRILPELPDDLGVCVPCADNDQDGACNVDDCAPNDAQIAPGLPDLCHNLVDNDCDDLVDEGCDIPDIGVDAALMPEDAGVDAETDVGGEVLADAATGDASDGALVDADPIQDAMVPSDMAADSAPDSAQDMMVLPDTAQDGEVDGGDSDVDGIASDGSTDMGDAGDADSEAEPVFKTGRIQGGSVIVACDCSQGTTDRSGFIWGLLLLLLRLRTRRRT